MKHDYSQDGFEDFLKRSSDRLKLRPSEKVWAAISADLNKKRRRAGWMTSLLLLIVASGGYLAWLQQTGNEITAHVTRPSQKTSSAERNTPATALKVAHRNFDNQKSPLTTIASATQPAERNTLTAADNNLRVAFHHQSLPLIRNNRVTAAAAHEPVPTEIRNPDNAGLGNETDAPHTNVIAAANDFQATIVDTDPEHQSLIAAAETPKAATASLPHSIESVTNQSFAVKPLRKLRIQFNFTPTISYRTLSRNDNYRPVVGQSGLTPDQLAPLSSLNDAVVHKPGMGLEMGLSAQYKVSRSVGFQAGLQFNMSHYDIKAFSSNTEPAPVANRNGEARITASNYRNFGYGDMETDWLQNMYFQVVAPVGANYRFRKNGRTQFGIAGTVQPSYVVSERAYLLSTDYKSYVEVPWLVRRWNVGTAVETFVIYNTSRLTYQVGPQVRYQLLSSFVSNYPVKENLLDFGLKVGVSLNK